MEVKLTPEQIPQAWEQIKYAASRTGLVTINQLENHCNLLLANLLSSKADCFLSFDDERKIELICITEFKRDLYSGEVSLFLNSLYGFAPLTSEKWLRCLDFIKEYAKANKCKYIEAFSPNNRAIEIMQGLGFEEIGRFFRVNL